MIRNVTQAIRTRFNSSAQQVDTFTPSNIQIGDVFTLTVVDYDSNSDFITYTAIDQLATTVSGALISLWNAEAGSLFTPITATGTDTVILTADAVTTAFTVIHNTPIDAQFTRAATVPTGGDTLRAALTGGLFFMEADDATVAPYGVFSWDGGNLEETAGTRRDAIETASMTFALFSDKDDGELELFDIVEKFMEVFDWCKLDYPAGIYTHLAMQRTSAINRGKLDNVWEIDLAYNVMFNH